MAFELEIKGKKEEIKFDYALVFKINKQLANKDKDGNNMKDGIGTLFSGILNQDDDALFNILRIAINGKLSDKEISDTVELFVSNYEDEEQGYQALFAEVKEEMVNSGFFKQKIEKYIETMEKAAKMLMKKTDEESKLTVETINEQIRLMKKEI